MTPKANDLRSVLALLERATPGALSVGPEHVIRFTYTDEQGRRCTAFIECASGGQPNAANAAAIVAAVNFLRKHGAALLHGGGGEAVESKGLRHELQVKCSKWGAYWRAPDSHGVILTIEQATELLEEAVNVEVEITTPPTQVWLTDASHAWAAGWEMSARQHAQPRGEGMFMLRISTAKGMATLPVDWANMTVEGVKDIPAEVMAQINVLRATAAAEGDIFPIHDRRAAAPGEGSGEGENA